MCSICHAVMMADGHTEQRYKLTLKDIFGQVWLLLPAVIAAEQLVRLSGGNTVTLLALASAVDIKSLLLGVTLPISAALAAILLAIHLSDVVNYVATVMHSRLFGWVTWLGVFALCVLYIPWYFAALLALSSVLWIFNSPQGRNQFLALLFCVSVVVVPAFSPSWTPSEVLTTKSGQIYVAYVINPDQGGWMTILTVHSSHVIRLASSDVAARSICDAHPKNWRVDAYPTPIIRQFYHHPRIPSCPRI
jgi:hypothetical protein